MRPIRLLPLAAIAVLAAACFRSPPSRCSRLVLWGSGHGGRPGQIRSRDVGDPACVV